MSSEGAQVVCDPNRIRLTGAAALVIGRFLIFVFLSDGDYCIIWSSMDRLSTELG